MLSEAANAAGYEKVPIAWNNIGMQLLDPKKFSAYSSLKEFGNKELELVLNLPQNKEYNTLNNKNSNLLKELREREYYEKKSARNRKMKKMRALKIKTLQKD